VLEAKAEIERIEGTPHEGQQLLCGGRVLGNQELLGEILPARAKEVEVLLMRLDPRRTAALKGLRDGHVELEDLEEELRSDRDVVLAAVQVDGHSLRYASEELKQDRSVVLAAVKESGMALQHAGEEPRKDREVVLSAVGCHSQALRYACAELRGDQEVILRMLKTCRTDPEAMTLAAESLLEDREFMLKAVAESAMVFRFASSKLQADREMVLLAVKTYPDAFFYADPALQCNRDFVLEVVGVNGYAITHATPDIREDATVLAKAMKNTPKAVSFLRRMNPVARNRILKGAIQILQDSKEGVGSCNQDPNCDLFDDLFYR
jgi:hypothetical protein